MNLDSKHHAEAVEILMWTFVEEKEPKRVVACKFVAKLYAESGPFETSSLESGLADFVEGELYDDMKMDLPALSKIVKEEVVTAVADLLGDAADRIRTLA